MSSVLKKADKLNLSLSLFIDWQQYWKCDWTMNIGANRNAHGKQTVSTKQPHKSRSERLDSWASRLWRGIELVFKSLDCLTVRLLELRVVFFFFFFFFFEGGGGGGGGAQLQSIYYLVLYTDLKAAEGN